MTCCVIGGTGFIGRVVVQQLVAGGREVRVIGRREQRPASLDEKASYLSGDYGDKAFLERALSGVDEIIDLAYSTVPKSSFEDPIHDITTNLPQAVNLFQVVSERKNIRKLVVVSSGGTVYGPALAIPITEDHPTNPISPYGITKLAVEKYALMYHRLFNLPVSIVRPSNAYGEGQLPYRGQGFIATAIASILNGDAVTVFGGDQIIRDYIHVADVADGIVATLESGRPGAFYNLGSGSGLTTNQVLSFIAALAHQIDKSVAVEAKPLRAFDVPANILDCTRIQADTGWRTKISFAEGLDRVWQEFLVGHSQPRTN
ncbi:MAG: NAD-dependent epimerase/dehydratase family protein [Sulfuricellaceae bacterium]|nr:NAD-dependent epimerase/dehydratase family protein [Sulfuricellaceae bacterium]